IFVHATYLFLILFIREMIKDLENLRGDFTHNYKTLPVVYGIKATKIVISIAFLLTLVPTFILLSGKMEIGYMYYFFILSFLLLTVVLVLLWKSTLKIHYTLLHNLLKLIIVLGVFSILLIKIDVVLDRL